VELIQTPPRGSSAITKKPRGAEIWPSAGSGTSSLFELKLRIRPSALTNLGRPPTVETFISPPPKCVTRGDAERGSSTLRIPSKIVPAHRTYSVEMRLVLAFALAFSALLFCGCSEKSAKADTQSQSQSPSQSPQLFVEWHGSWWAAHAIGGTNDGRTVVHYDGWGTQWDELVTPARIARATNDGKLFVEWHGSWWPAHAIGRTNDGRPVVHYDGWGNEWDEVVTSSRVARPTSDGKLFVEWHRSWWPATVISSEKNGALRVHYDGWGNEWDETVGADRVTHLTLPRQ
jgi:hypothetical protein